MKLVQIAFYSVKNYIWLMFLTEQVKLKMFVLQEFFFMSQDENFTRKVCIQVEGWILIY